MQAVIDLRTVGDRFPGIGRYAYNLARTLVRRKDRPELLLIWDPTISNTRYDLAALSLGTGVRALVTNAPPFTLREQTLLPLLLRRLSPDIGHFPAWIMPWAAPRPFIVTIHDVIPLRLPEYFNALRRMLYRVSLSFLLRHAAAVVYLSHATRSDVAALFPGACRHSWIIPAGVEACFHPRAKSELQSVRAKYALPEQYLLYVGSNKPHKNLPALVEAYARARAAPTLILAGLQDSRYPETLQRIEALGLGERVRVLGAIPEEDLPLLYNSAWAFIFPSLYEGFGLPPLEAMASGTPVACSDLPSLRETTAGAALLFDTRDIDSIASALQRITWDQQLRQDLRERGLRRAAQLTWESVADRILDIYYRLC